MAPTRPYSFGLRVLITVFLLFSLTISPSLTADNWISRMQQQKKTLGSRPPGCVNKCMNCTPCRATLVIPPHHRMTDYRDQSSHREDDCYYLLSWKCKCGDKLFQP
ncbi:EPIDERMAL PATTERNING FACTOR-like protein 8 [Cynara cardunculus var. scolymus]|uniref:EPIDERMAL PATTERNING FACTOR-like protein 8 n=1 Tax=Cynara cardunculus var. scolymus TaxID=59895 RepID=UPI000D62353D|nr:EPIDERMAL PATTERNING FACTOR-like protein 8 [Cynara cardunculus var. scolymus]